MKARIAAAVLAAVAWPAAAQDAPATVEFEPAEGAHDYGFAGLLARDNRTDLPPLTLSSGQPVADGVYELKSGTYYRIDIVADGTAELALSGGDFFRSVWINEIVINDIEVRPMGIHSLEFDAAGTANMSFIAIVPGTYRLSIPGSDSELTVGNVRHSVREEGRMKAVLFVLAAAIAAPSLAMAQEVTEEHMARIDEVLTAKQCEVDPANVEVEDDGFDLDDVMCASGQYDIKLDANFTVLEERKE